MTYSYDRTAAARRKNYRYDRRRLKNLNDPEGQREEAREYGVYTKTEIKLIPIKDIQLPPVWGPEKYEQAKKLIEAGKPLDPINVSRSGSKWLIQDGIHRTHASKDLGFTHVPAFVQTEVSAPELYDPPEPEKKKLSKGKWVKLRKPNYRGFSYGWVTEYLTRMIRKDVPRHRYALKFINEAGQLDFGDYSDDEFDPVRPPPALEKARAELDGST